MYTHLFNYISVCIYLHMHIHMYINRIKSLIICRLSTQGQTSVLVWGLKNISFYVCTIVGMYICMYIYVI